MTVTDKTPQITVTGSYGWAAAGNDGPDPDNDTGRLLTAAWVTSKPSSISLLRELKWDPKSKQLVSALAPEYTKLHNGTFTVPKGAIKPGATVAAPIPAPSAGTLDLLYSFTPDKAATQFGVSVKSGTVVVLVESVVPDNSGGFDVNISFVATGTSKGFNHGEPAASKIIKVLQGETIDLRLLIDRPVVEIFVNDGRASHVAVNDYFQSNTTAIAAFNKGT